MKTAPTQKWLETVATGTVSVCVVQVTPAMAAAWLAQNKSNRKLRKAHINSLAEEMRRGEWSLTHQGIAFGVSGRLLDGQHRLSAIVQSNTTQAMMVFTDVPETGFANFDRGASRNFADILHQDTEIVTLGNTLIRFCTRGAFQLQRKATPAEVRNVLEVLWDDIVALRDASLAKRTGRTLSPIKVAWLVRHHTANEEGKKILREQWKAFAEYNTKAMDESTAAGDKRLEHLRAIRGGSLDVELGCIGWLMFNSLQRDLDRIIVKSSEALLNGLRASVRAFLPALVPMEAAAIPKERFSPFADPVLGPQYRAKAAEATLAKRSAAHVERT